MADDGAQLVVALEARVRDFEKNFQKAAKTSDENWSRIEARGRTGAANVAKAMSEATSGIGEHLGRMAREGAGALTAALGLEELRRMADEWTSFRGKIAASGVATEDLNGKLRELSDIAIRSHASLETVATVYTSLRRAAAELGASEAQTLVATETLQKALALSGQGPEQAKYAVLEIGHALSQGQLNGVELNKLLAEAPVLVQAIAKEFGVSAAQLRAIKEEGQSLSSDKVFAGILHASTDIEASFAKLHPTISQSMQMLETSMTRYIGEADQADGISRALASSIMTLGDNINVVAPAAFALASGLSAAFIGGPIVGGITAATVALVGFSDQIRPIAGDMATLGDYARVAFDIVKQKGGEAARYLEESFASVATSLSAAMAGAGVALEPLLSAVKTLANGIIGAFAFAGQTVVISWGAVIPELAEATVHAVNGVLAAIETMTNKAVAAINELIAGLNKVTGASFSPLATVDLGRIKDASEGAAAATKKALQDAYKDSFRDYVGGALDIAKAGLGAAGKGAGSVRDRANKEHEDRTKENEVNKPSDEGSLDQPLKSTPDPRKVKAYNELLTKGREFIQTQELERREITETAEAASALRHEQEMMNAATEKEITLTADQKAQIKELAQNMAAAETATQKLVDMKAGIQALGETITDSLVSTFDALISRSNSWAQSLRALGQQMLKMALDAALWGKGPLAEITGTKDNGLLNGVVRGMLPKSNAQPQQFLPTPAIPIGGSATVNAGNVTVIGHGGIGSDSVASHDMQSTASKLGHGGIGSDAVASGAAGASPYGDLKSAASALQSTASAGSSTAESVASRLMKDYGLTREQAIGATGVMGYESGNFQVMQERGHSGVNSGWGYAQWTGPRRQQFMNYANQNGLDPSSDAANYGFLRHELDTNYSHVIPAMKGTSNVQDAARTWEEQFEGMREGGPGVPAFQGHINRALAYDQQLPQNLGGDGVQAIDSALTKGSTQLTTSLGTLDSSVTQGATGLSGALGKLAQAMLGGAGGGATMIAAIPGFADGGFINGAGSGSSDSNLAMVSDGEFVVNAGAASKYGPLLSAINEGKAPNFMKSTASNVSSIANHFGGNTVNIHGVDANNGREVANHVVAAMNDPSQRNKFSAGTRYSAGQQAAMAGRTIQHAQKAHS